MDSPLRKLTLFCPTANESALIDCLESMEPELPLYLRTEAHARGAAVEDLESAREKVSGAMHASVFTMVLPEAQIQAVLEATKLACAQAHLSYWIERADDFGVLE